MNIFNLLDEYNSKKRYYTEKNEAIEQFMQQKKAIHAIKGTKGFKEIRDYRGRVVVACNDRLRTIKSEEIKRVQGELDTAMQFLDFLDNILSEGLDKEDIDILNSN